MNQVKYQIFVSSTFKDLIDERNTVIKSILEIGHIPVGMEMFSAGDEEQWQLIKRTIDDCDYYLVIIGGKYGSMDGDISFTEKEYDYAKSKGIPTLGFVIDSSVDIPSSKIDINEEKLLKLEQFKSKVQGKIINYWKNKDDLTSKVLAALTKQFNINPRVGWIKSSETSADPKVLSELTRLSKENDALRKKNKELVKHLNASVDEENIELLELLFHHEITLTFFYEGGKKWENNIKVNFLLIFELIYNELLIENSYNYLLPYLGTMLNPKPKRPISKKNAIPKNTLSSILSDLETYDLIKPSEKKHKLEDSNQYWTLTPKAKEFNKILRKIKIKDSLKEKKGESGN